MTWIVVCGVSVGVFFLLVLVVRRTEDIMRHCYSLGARGPLNRRDGISVRLSGALLRMGDRRLPKRVVSGELENAGKRGPGGKGK